MGGDALMKYALISPQENDRFCQVEDTAFSVAAPLFWIECAGDVTPETHRYVDGAFELIPPPPPPPPAPPEGAP
jgi:hypothetical protein